MNRLIVKPIPREQCDAIDLRPARTARRAREAETHGKADAAENADLLAEEQRQRDAEHQRLDQDRGSMPPSETPALAKPNSGTIA